MAAHPRELAPEQRDPGRAMPEILTVTPDPLVLAGSRSFDPLTLHMTYRIVHPEKVDRVVLKLWNDAVGVIDTTPVPLQEHGTLDWTVAGPVNVGPLVRLRAHCPDGETNSFVWGAPRQPSDAALTITGTSPGAARSGVPEDADPASETVPVEVFGNGLSPDCRLIANINGTDVTLTTNAGRVNALTGFIRRDMMPHPVLMRWFDLELIVHDSDGGTQAVRRVPLVD